MRTGGTPISGNLHIRYWKIGRMTISRVVREDVQRLETKDWTHLNMNPENTQWFTRNHMIIMDDYGSLWWVGKGGKPSIFFSNQGVLICMCHFSSRAGFSCDGFSRFFCRMLHENHRTWKGFFQGTVNASLRGFEDEPQPIPNGFESSSGYQHQKWNTFRIVNLF